MESATEAVQDLLLDDDRDKGSSTPQPETPTKVEEKKPKKETTSANQKMAAASKELSPEEKDVANSSFSLGSTIFSLAKKVAVVGGIYLVGYMGWSVAWLIG